MVEPELSSIELAFDANVDPIELRLATETDVGQRVP